MAEAVRVGQVDAFRDSRPQQLVRLLESDMSRRRRAGAALDGGTAAAAPAGDAPDLGAGDRDLRERPGAPPVEGAPEADASEDVRTPRVRHGERGERHKPWSL